MSATPQTAPIEVLLVEDSVYDAELTVRVLREAGIRNLVHVAADGADALDFLHRRGRHTDAPRPDLILLDLNLPKIDGRAVLEAVKGDERLRQIPLIVITGSTDERDVVQSYRRHANAYVVKPLEAKAFLEAVKSLEQFWLQIVRLP